MKYTIEKSTDHVTWVPMDTFTGVDEIELDLRASAEPGDIIVPPTAPPPGAEFTSVLHGKTRDILGARIQCPDGGWRHIRLYDWERRYVIACDESQLPQGGDTDVTLSYEWIKSSGQ